MADPVNPGQKRPSIYPQTIIRNKALNLNAPTRFNTDYPLGPGYYTTRFRASVAITAGTAAGPITEGLLNYIRNVLYETDNGEVLVKNLPARVLYKIAQTKSKSAPRVDAIAAADGTYVLDIVIYHVDPLSARPEDTILDTSRYNSLNFEVLTGTAADLFTAPGTATINSVTLDVTVKRSKYKWDSAGSPPIGFTQYGARNPVDASQATEIALERASDLWYKRLFFHTSTSGSSGRIWQGINSDVIIDRLKVTDSDDTHANDLIWKMWQDDNKDEYQFEAVPSGALILDFCDDNSNWSALWSNRNSLKAEWVNVGSPGANSFVSLVYEGYRTLRPPRDSK